jgi:hypothetical protein
VVSGYLSSVDVWAARAHANGLGSDRAGAVVEAVRRVVALQGQDVRANRLAVRVRTCGLTQQDVDDAIASGDVVRTWAMRGTLHMLASADLGWVLQVVGPYFRDRLAPRRRQLGLGDADCELGVAQLESVLTEPLTRAEIKERVDLDLDGQAAPAFLAFAALSGVVCRGPERGSEPTYVLVRDWVKTGTDDQLAVRYLRGHGPAGPADLAAWAGLPLGVARRAFDEVRDLLEPVGELFVLKGAEPEEVTTTRLLGHFDAFLLGYRERPVPAEHTRKIQSGGGFVMPAVSERGRVVGTWEKAGSTEDELVVKVTPFTTITTRLRRELADEVSDLGRFLGRRSGLAVSATAITD